MTRAFVLTFLGKPRDQHLFDHAHEVSWTMWFPQAVLAVFAVIVGWSIFGLGANIHATAPSAAQPFLEGEMEHGYHFVHVKLLHGFGWMVSIATGYLLYMNGFVITSRVFALPLLKQAHWLVYNKFGFDGLYDIVGVNVGKGISYLAAAFDRAVVDGVVNGVAWIGKQLGFLVGGFDYNVVDGTVRGSGRSAMRLGAVLHRTQGGNIRTYVTILVVTAFVGLAVAIPFTLQWMEFGLPTH